MASVILTGLKVIANSVGGPAGYFGKAVLSVLEEIVNDFDELKQKTQTLDAAYARQAELLKTIEERLKKVEDRDMR